MTAQHHRINAASAAALHVAVLNSRVFLVLIDHFRFILFLLVGNFSKHSLRVPASLIHSSDFPRCDFPSAEWVSELCLKAALPRTCSNVYIGLFVFEEK